MKKKTYLMIAGATCLVTLVGCSTKETAPIVYEPVIDDPIVYESCSDADKYTLCELDNNNLVVKLTDDTVIETLSIKQPFMDEIGLQANMYCLGKGEGWRLPTYQELQYAVEHNQNNVFGFEMRQYWANEYISQNTPVNIDAISINGVTGDGLATHGVQHHYVKCVMDLVQE